jgi:hypothetical protein
MAFSGIPTKAIDHDFDVVVSLIAQGVID